MLALSPSSGSAAKRRCAAGWFCAALLALPLAATAAEEPPADAEQRLGCVVRVDLPVTGRTVDRVQRFVRRAVERARGERKRLTLIFEFAVAKDQEAHGRGSEFGAALALADFLTSEEIAGAQTVAYLPQTVEGHAVLPILACDELIMSRGAALGPAGVDEKGPSDSRLGNYREIAARRKTIPIEVALWLLDPKREVLVVKTDAGREFVSPEGLKALSANHPILQERKLFDPDSPADSLTAEPGRISAEEGRSPSLDLVRYLADSREEAARALGLKAAEIDEDLTLAGEWRALRVDLKGPIRGDLVAQAQRLIADEIRAHNANLICVWIDSPGGSLADSIAMANFLAQYQGTRVRTVAYVPAQARSDAALIALGCQQVVMHPRADLGGPGAREFTREEIQQAETAIRDEAGPWRNRSWSQIAAMIDPQLAVFRCVRPGDEGWFSDRELENMERKQPEAKRWQKMEQVTVPAQQYTIDGATAVERGLAYKTVGDLAGFKATYGLEEDPALLETGWADFLVDAMASPGVAVLLLVIGFAGLYVELHAPGIGVGGFVALLSFVLFFWSRYLGGTAGWLEATLFAVGVICLLLEIFVIPGFGIFGLGGGALVLLSLILASQTFVVPHNAWQYAQLQRTLLMFFAAGVAVLAAAAIFRRWLPKAPMLEQVFLPPPEGREAEEIRRRETLADYGGLLGLVGVTTTPLHPSGKARFGERLVDVVSDGDAVARGEQVEVIAVQGSRVVVRAARR